MKTFKKIALIAVLVGVVLAASGCVLIVADPGVGTLRVQNATAEVVNYVEISPAGSGDWTRYTVNIPAFTTQDITDIEAGYYDIYADLTSSFAAVDDFHIIADEVNPFIID